MDNNFNIHDVIQDHSALAKEIEFLLSILPMHDDISKENLIIAGIFAKLDMILEELQDISFKIDNLTTIEDKKRVITWLQTTTTK